MAERTGTAAHSSQDAESTFRARQARCLFRTGRLPAPSSWPADSEGAPSGHSLPVAPMRARRRAHPASRNRPGPNVCAACAGGSGWRRAPRAGARVAALAAALAPWGRREAPCFGLSATRAPAGAAALPSPATAVTIVGICGPATVLLPPVAVMSARATINGRGRAGPPLQCGVGCWLVGRRPQHARY